MNYINHELVPKEHKRYFIAFDPGDTTGWALFSDQGVLFTGQIEGAVSGFNKWAAESAECLKMVSCCIFEEYTAFKPGPHRTGAKFETSQVIGAIKTIGSIYKWTMVGQPSRILPVAEQWTQVKRPSNHAVSHGICAFLHGSYYLIQNNIMMSALELEQLNGS